MASRQLIFLSCLTANAFAYVLREGQLQSEAVNVAEVKSEESEAQQLREKAAELQKELSDIVQEQTSENADTHKAANPTDSSLLKDLSASTGSNASASPPAVATATQNKNEKMVRPSAAANKPDIVTFGVYAKNLFGTDLKHNSFAIDIVTSLKWKDERVVKLLPEGLDETTLSKRESELKMWLPGIAVTNRDIKRYDLVSTAVMINRKGEVFKVERATVSVKNKYILNDYPYDTQKLVVKIASTKYMIDELVLEPAKSGTGVAKDLLKRQAYDFVDVGSTAIKDVDGALKKSRGLFTITVKRVTTPYTQTHLVPTFLLTCISCGVHWFPFVAPFITPRVALSVLALLAFTNLVQVSDKSLPPGAPFNWNDLFNQTILTIMFCNIVSVYIMTCGQESVRCGARHPT